MFRSWIFIKELALNLAKVIFMLKHSVLSDTNTHTALEYMLASRKSG